MGRVADLTANLLQTVGRAGLGRTVGPLGDRPAEPLTLYDVEGCPYCRPVREAITMLDLEVRVRPVPIGGTRFTAELGAHPGAHGVPFLVDPNVGVALGEADHLIHHLYRHYGAGDVPRGLLGAWARASSPVLSKALGDGGTHARPSRAPSAPLELWSFEACPWCRRVRERLTELELPYVLHTMGKGSPKRPAFAARHGRTLFPYLEDPNTGVALYESADICSYLDRTWGAVGG